MEKQISPKERKEIEKEIPISYSEIEGRVKFIQGKVLTVVEASMADKDQRKATKDLIKHIFSENLTKFHNDTHPNCKMLSESDMCAISGSVDKFYDENMSA